MEAQILRQRTHCDTLGISTCYIYVHNPDTTLIAVAAATIAAGATRILISTISLPESCIAFAQVNELHHFKVNRPQESFSKEPSVLRAESAILRDFFVVR
jgi:hypothetical protein